MPGAKTLISLLSTDSETKDIDSKVSKRNGFFSSGEASVRGVLGHTTSLYRAAWRWSLVLGGDLKTSKSEA